MAVLHNRTEHVVQTIWAISGDFTCKSGVRLLTTRLRSLNLPCKYSF